MCEKDHLNLDDWSQGHAIAMTCVSFQQDVEEECVADEIISCYNCRYRRWTQSGIQCMKPPEKKD